MPRRLIELDGLRGLAALSVMIGHAIGMLPEEGAVAWLQASPLRILWDGDAAVMLFFVLSGYVLALPYAEGRPLDVRAFLVRRVFRLYPAYWFAIAFSLAAMVFHRPENLAGLSEWFRGFWTAPVPPGELARTLLMAGPGFDSDLIDPPVWSLLIEMSVSLVLPAFLALLLRLRGAVRWIAVVALGAALTLALERFRYLDLFLLGTALAFFSRVLVARLAAWPPAARWGVVALGAALYGAKPLGLPPGGLTPELIAVGAALLLLGALAVPPLRAFLSSRGPRFLGEVSYSLYLLHFPILLVSASLLLPITGIVGVWAVAFAATLALSSAVYRAVELPAQRLGRRLDGSGRRTPTAGAGASEGR